MLGDAAFVCDGAGLPLAQEDTEAEPLSWEREGVRLRAPLSDACAVADDVTMAEGVAAPEAVPVAFAEAVTATTEGEGVPEEEPEPEDVAPPALANEFVAPPLALVSVLPVGDTVPLGVAVDEAHREVEGDPELDLLVSALREAATLRKEVPVAAITVFDCVGVTPGVRVMPRGVSQGTGLRDCEGEMEALPEEVRHTVGEALLHGEALVLPEPRELAVGDAEPVTVRVREVEKVALGERENEELPVAVFSGESVGETVPQVLALTEALAKDTLAAPLGDSNAEADAEKVGRAETVPRGETETEGQPDDVRDAEILRVGEKCALVVVEVEAEGALLSLRDELRDTCGLLEPVLHPERVLSALLLSSEEALTETL